ncbi:MAG TPA: hypothetical protein VJ838_12485 [Gaiellaceae bacterium]|nr:hypothetical protein [Gaiellaceae bacterium]
MPLWLRKRPFRPGGRKVIRAQKARFEIKAPAGQTEANRTAMAQEIEAETARYRAAIEEIAERHGAEFKLLEDD